MYVDACDELHLHGTSVTLYRRVSPRQQLNSRSTVLTNRNILARSTSFKLNRLFKRPLIQGKLTKKRQEIVREKIPVHLARIPSECESVAKRTGRCCQDLSLSIDNQQLRRIRQAQDLTEFQELLSVYHSQEELVKSRQSDYEHFVYEQLYNTPITHLQNLVQDFYDGVGPVHMSNANALEELTRELRQARLSDDDQDSSAPLITVSDCSGNSSSASSVCGYSENGDGDNTVRLTVPRVTSVTCESRPP